MGIPGCEMHPSQAHITTLGFPQPAWASLSEQDLGGSLGRSRLTQVA